MKESCCRLSEIIIKGFKNVRYGKIELEDSAYPGRSSVLGIYGQNGSGKTAVVEALGILSHILKGEEISPEYCNLINVDSEEACFSFSFDILEMHESYKVVYEAYLRKSQDKDGVVSSEPDHSFLEIYREIIFASYTGNSSTARKRKIIDTDTDGIFLPVGKVDLLLGNVDADRKMKLLVGKNLLRMRSRSFIFSKLLDDAISYGAEEKKADIEYSIWKDMLSRLRYYGENELFVIGTRHSGMITMDTLPLMYTQDIAGSHYSGMISLPLRGRGSIPLSMLGIIEKACSSMNKVLECLVPGLTIEVRNHGGVTLSDGTDGVVVELLSLKNSKAIPLSDESEGIKKIISVLQLLITAFMNPSVTVVIDEIDSGIFEYLLGELVRILSRHGHGQLIFTSHNLRPLETISKNSILFATTNPDNRYIRMANVKSNNNLRDFYFRDIVMSEQKECLYNYVDNSSMVYAFMAAGGYEDVKEEES